MSRAVKDFSSLLPYSSVVYHNCLMCTVLGHAWIALKIPCLKKKNDSCPPAENMLLIFMWELFYDEKYIAEFIFISLSGKSEPRQWDALLMNTFGRESIRNYIPHQKHLNVLQRCKTKLAFTLDSFTCSVFHMFGVCSLISSTQDIYPAPHIAICLFFLCGRTE